MVNRLIILATTIIKPLFLKLCNKILFSGLIVLLLLLQQSQFLHINLWWKIGLYWMLTTRSYVIAFLADLDVGRLLVHEAINKLPSYKNNVEGRCSSPSTSFVKCNLDACCEFGLKIKPKKLNKERRETKTPRNVYLVRSKLTYFGDRLIFLHSTPLSMISLQRHKELKLVSTSSQNKP